MVKVLSFGHIPSSVGGRQSSGLANVIFQLALHSSRQDGIDMTLAATDVFKPEITINELKVLGWTKGLLIKHAFCHPFKTLCIAKNTIRFKTKYSPLVSVPGLLLKGLFLDYAIKKIQPDIVHLHGAHSVFYYPIVPKKCKLVVTLHGSVGNDDNLPHKEMHAVIERACCTSNRIDKLCTVSSLIPTVLKDMYGDVAPSVEVILNAFDSNVFKYIEPIKHDKLTLCTIASFSKLKGQERVIDAFIASKANYRYFCIGHISYDDIQRIEKKAQKIDFKWLGVKKPTEIREILAECDYMILPSSSEGFGLVYLEAIACGVPVIIPKNLPLALEDDILNNQNAIMINDCTSSAIQSILFALKDKVWNHKDVSNTVVSYTWDNIGCKYASVYKSVI